MRVYTEVGVKVEGNIDLGRSYISHARTLLGIMKAFNNNLQVQNWNRELADGTRVYLSSIHGRDFIRIVAPPAIQDESVLPYFLFTYDDGTDYSQYSSFFNSAGTTKDLVAVAHPFDLVSDPPISLRGEGTVRNGDFSWSLPYGTNLLWKYDSGSGIVGSTFYYNNVEYYVDAAGGDPLFGVLEKDGKWYAFTYYSDNSTFYIQTSMSDDQGASWVAIDYKYVTVAELNSKNNTTLSYTTIRTGDCSPAWSISHNTDASKICICLHIRARAGLYVSVVPRYSVSIDGSSVTWSLIEVSALEYFTTSTAAGSSEPIEIFNQFSSPGPVHYTIGDHNYTNTNTRYEGYLIVGAEYDSTGKLVIATFEPGTSQYPSRLGLDGSVLSGREYISYNSPGITLDPAGTPIVKYNHIDGHWIDSFTDAVESVRAAWAADYPDYTVTITDLGSNDHSNLIAGSLTIPFTVHMVKAGNPDIDTPASVTLQKGYPALIGSTDCYYLYKATGAVLDNTGILHVQFNASGTILVQCIAGNRYWSEGYLGVLKPYFDPVEYTQTWKNYYRYDAPWDIVFRQVGTDEDEIYPYSSTILSRQYLDTLFNDCREYTVTYIYKYVESPSYSGIGNVWYTYTEHAEISWLYEGETDDEFHVQDVDILNQTVLQYAAYARRYIDYTPRIGSSGRIAGGASTTFTKNTGDDIYDYNLSVMGEELVYDSLATASLGSTSSVSIIGGLPGFTVNTSPSESSQLTSTDYESLFIWGGSSRVSPLATLKIDNKVHGIYHIRSWNTPTIPPASGLFKYTAPGIYTVTNDIYTSQYWKSPISGKNIGLLNIKTAN